MWYERYLSPGTRVFRQTISPFGCWVYGPNTVNSEGDYYLSDDGYGPAPALYSLESIVYQDAREVLPDQDLLMDAGL